MRFSCPRRLVESTPHSSQEICSTYCIFDADDDVAAAVTQVSRRNSKCDFALLVRHGAGAASLGGRLGTREREYCLGAALCL